MIKRYAKQTITYNHSKINNLTIFIFLEIKDNIANYKRKKSRKTLVFWLMCQQSQVKTWIVIPSDTIRMFMVLNQ